METTEQNFKMSTSKQVPVLYEETEIGNDESPALSVISIHTIPIMTPKLLPKIFMPQKKDMQPDLNKAPMSSSRPCADEISEDIRAVYKATKRSNIAGSSDSFLIDCGHLEIDITKAAFSIKEGGLNNQELFLNSQTIQTFSLENDDGDLTSPIIRTKGNHFEMICNIHFL